MSLLDNYEIGDVDELSDAEVMVLLAAAKQEEQSEQARRELKRILDVRNAETPRTIKLN